MIEILLTSQSPISAFDNKNGRLYFDFLTRKTHELNFDVFIRNVELSVRLKMTKESSQSDAYSSRYRRIPIGVKVIKLLFFYT